MHIYEESLVHGEGDSSHVAPSSPHSDVDIKMSLTIFPGR